MKTVLLYLTLFCLVQNILSAQTDTVWSTSQVDVYYDATRYQIDSAQMLRGINNGRYSSYQYLKGNGSRRLMMDAFYKNGKVVSMRSFDYSSSVAISSHISWISADGSRSYYTYMIGNRKLWTYENRGNPIGIRHTTYYHNNNTIRARGREKGRKLRSGCDAGMLIYHKQGWWIYYLGGLPILPVYYFGIFKENLR